MTEKRKTGSCDLCQRPNLTGLSFHHLIPKALHSTAWFEKRYDKAYMGSHGLNICRECHHAIHEFIPKEKDLGREYNTKELLLAHPMIAIHVKWIAKRSFQRHKV
jgi:5-methylcytosine-specific restriction endonuclease McrA